MQKINEIITAGAVVFKKAANGRTYWFLVKEEKDSSWEIPKMISRKGESSVRASIRMMAEKAGMNAKVLEEAGRFGGSTTINGRSVPRRNFYYLMIMKSSGENLAFFDTNWFQYKTAYRQLELKKEKEMLKNAKAELLEWRKKRALRKKKKKV